MMGETNKPKEEKQIDGDRDRFAGYWEGIENGLPMKERVRREDDGCDAEDVGKTEKEIEGGVATRRARLRRLRF